MSHSQPVGADRRPGTVTAAAVVTLVLAGLGFLFLAGSAVLMAVLYDDFVGAIADQVSPGNRRSFSSGAVAAIVLTSTVVLAGWALVAVGLAALVLRRSNLARILLIASSAMTALLSLVAIGSVISVVTLLAGIAVVVLLLTGGAGNWYARRGPR